MSSELAFKEIKIYEFSEQTYYLRIIDTGSSNKRFKSIIDDNDDALWEGPTFDSRAESKRFVYKFPLFLNIERLKALGFVKLN
jgi:hypothetical protein